MLLFSASITARFAALLLAMAPATPAADESNGTEFTCPVGGEIFRQYVENMGYPLAGPPNGSTLGGNLSDIIVPECPSNGLVMVPKYDGEEGEPAAMAEYSPEEIAKLPGLIASPEYKAMLGEARFLRLYWLATKLNRPAPQLFHLLQHVSWIGSSPEQHRKYLELFVKDGEAFAKSDDFDPEFRFQIKFYIANALRELGRFDEAKARLLNLQQEWPPLFAAMKAKIDAENPHFELEPILYDYQSETIASLLGAIAEHDDDYAPVSMMDDKWANLVCGDLDDAYPPATEATKRGCMKRKLDNEREDKLQNEELELRGNPLELGRLCETTPVVDRSEALAGACEGEEGGATAAAEVLYRDTEAERLLKNPKLLQEQCKDVKIPDGYFTAKTALGEACLRRAETIRDKEKSLLVIKMRRYPSEYDRLCHWDYPSDHSMDPTELACNEIKEERDDAYDKKERARLAKMTEAEIWAECEKADDGDDAQGYVLRFRCSDIKRDRDDAKWAALQADPVQLAAVCSKPYAEKEEWQQDKCYIYNENIEDAAALKLAVDHEALTASCAATPMPQRNEVLRKACRSYLKCVVVRADQLPFYEVFIGGMGEPDDPAELRPACYDTMEKAASAYARYRADPKSLRASCVPETQYAGPLDPGGEEQCERYARGEDVFGDEGDATLQIDESKLTKSEKACLEKARKLDEDEMQDAVAKCVPMSKMPIVPPPPPRLVPAR